ncbi:MAG: DegV family protein, partial [Acholeplasmatales bacterium]|nr:DegV family protein [Acholeplasmatales bacterium]
TRTTINFKDKIYVDGQDITPDIFYELLLSKNEVPTTSAPTTGVIVGQIEKLMREGCNSVIHFPISFGLSDYGKNIKNIVDSLIPNLDFYVYNSKTACIMQGLFAILAENYALKGYTAQEIFTKLDDYRSRQTQYFVVDDLKYLIKNGRLSGITGNIGILLKLKPVLCLDYDGKIYTTEKIRTFSKATERIYEIIKDYTNNKKDVLYISIHTNKYDEAVKQKEKLDNEPNCFKTIISTITSTVGAHLGSGILGIVAICLNEEEKEIFSRVL